MKDKLTVLIVDDTETNIDILLELISERYDVLVALNGKSALEIVNKDKIDLVLLDIMMPDMDGYEVCEKLKRNPETKDIPVIFITAKTDEDSIEKAYEVGGVDYVTKPFKARELLARIKTQLDLKILIEHLEFIGSFDELTGIYNRRKFFELAEYQVDVNSENLYAVMIDIDKFKLINDAHGHPTGDEVIRTITRIISTFINEDSIFGRLGGEEFCIVCTLKDINEVSIKIEAIRKEVEKAEVISDLGETIKFTISAGYAKYNKNNKNLDGLLKEADKALYEAKGLGRNKVIFRS
jgi:diguanylate cyclase (GGDEF)-like protein